MAWGKEKPMIRMSLILMIRVSLGSRIFIVNRGSQSPRLAIIVTTAYPLFRCLPCIIKNCYELNPLRSFVQLRYLYPTNTPHKCVVPKSLVVVRSASRSSLPAYILNFCLIDGIPMGSEYILPILSATIGSKLQHQRLYSLY